MPFITQPQNLTSTKIKSRIEENELDLSLCGISKIPVPNMLSFTKVTILDLSCNKINSLPVTFVKLNHLVQVDLSKNSITELPYNFGELANLKKLDLFQNHLVELPISFCKLTNLQWLDLKANPMQDNMQSIVGDCLKPADCQKCAKNVVTYYRKKNLEKIEEQQNELKKEQKRLEKIRKEEEKVRQRKRAEKKRRLEEQKLQKLASNRTEDKKSLQSSSTIKGDAQLKKEESTATSGCFYHLYLLLILVLIAGLIFVKFFNSDLQEFKKYLVFLKERVSFHVGNVMTK